MFLGNNQARQSVEFVITSSSRTHVRDLRRSVIHFMIEPFKRQPHKMVKHTQTICWQELTNCLSVFEHFEGLALKELKYISKLHLKTKFVKF